MLVASHAATSSCRELRKRRAFVLGGDTLCFELARRPEQPRHQPSASLKAACQIDRLSLVSMQDVTSAPSKWRKTVDIDPSQEQPLLLLLLAVSTKTHTGSMHRSTVVHVQQTLPRGRLTIGVGTKG